MELWIETNEIKQIFGLEFNMNTKYILNREELVKISLFYMSLN